MEIQLSQTASQNWWMKGHKAPVCYQWRIAVSCSHWASQWGLSPTHTSWACSEPPLEVPFVCACAWIFVRTCYAKWMCTWVCNWMCKWMHKWICKWMHKWMCKWMSMQMNVCSVHIGVCKGCDSMRVVPGFIKEKPQDWWKYIFKGVIFKSDMLKGCVLCNWDLLQH